MAYVEANLPAFLINIKACFMHIRIQAIHHTFFGHTEIHSSCVAVKK